MKIIDMIKRGIDRREPKAWPVFGGKTLLDRSKFITASEIGYCARKVKLDKEAGPQADVESGHTKTKSTDDWGFFERGHNVEDWAQTLVKLGWDNNEYLPFYMGDDQVSFVDGYQSGTPDGVLKSATHVRIVEFKSYDPRTNVSKLPKIVHTDQVMQNLDLVSNALDLEPDGGHLVYIEASNYKNQFEFNIEWDQAHAERLEARAEMIANTAPEDLKPEGLFKDDCKYCNHTAICSRMIKAENNGESYDDDLKNAASGVFGQPKASAG